LLGEGVNGLDEALGEDVAPVFGKGEEAPMVFDAVLGSTMS